MFELFQCIIESIEHFDNQKSLKLVYYLKSKWLENSTFQKSKESKNH